MTPRPEHPMIQLIDGTTVDQHKKLIRSHEKIRAILPVQNSLIALDLILAVMSLHFAGQKLPVKHLIAKLHRSQTGVRYHYRWLLDEGWIVTEPCPLDARIKYIAPTDKLLEAYCLLLTELQADTPPPEST